MIHPIADTHTHTIACDHAYSTLNENAAAAAKKGLRFLAMTEHAPAVPGAPGEFHFRNYNVIPRIINGVVILKGVEVNIMDKKGALDLPDHILEKMEWVIASMHVLTYPPEDEKAHTRAWTAIAENPLVDVIGHCGDARYPFDMDAVLRKCRDEKKIVEINAHSFRVRPGTSERCERIARKCMDLGIPIVVSSDAHTDAQVGYFDAALRMLHKIGFPEELVLNGEYERFLAVAREKSGKLLTDEE